MGFWIVDFLLLITFTTLTTNQNFMYSNMRKLSSLAKRWRWRRRRRNFCIRWQSKQLLSIYTYTYRHWSQFATHIHKTHGTKIYSRAFHFSISNHVGLCISTAFPWKALNFYAQFSKFSKVFVCVIKRVEAKSTRARGKEIEWEIRNHIYWVRASEIRWIDLNRFKETANNLKTTYFHILW